MRPLQASVLSIVLIATALSGCLAGGEEQSATTTPSPSEPSATDAANATTPTSDASGNGTTPVAAKNTPPTANLSADPVNGTAPLNVTFTIDGADEDGDELNWTLDADGDGTEDYNGTGVPTTVLHEFTEPGNFTALLTVSDGTDNATSEFLVVVEAAAVAGPNICHRPTAATGVLYVHSEGGTWGFRESNGIPGLQVANNHPSGSNAGTLGFVNPAWVTCVQGDQMLF